MKKKILKYKIMSEIYKICLKYINDSEFKIFKVGKDTQTFECYMIYTMSNNPVMKHNFGQASIFNRTDVEKIKSLIEIYVKNQ